MTGPVADLRAPRRARVLVVEEDPRHAEALSRVLDAAGFHVAVVRSPALALRCMRDEQVAVVVLSNSVRGIAATTAMVSRLQGRPEPQLPTPASSRSSTTRSMRRSGWARMPTWC